MSVREKSAQGVTTMPNDMLDYKLLDPERAKAWEKFIKRKDVKHMMKDKQDFKFPLDGSYEVWCVAWEKAWDIGFHTGYKARTGKKK